ncbi:MAG: hypothetical protein ACR2NX_05340 [Chthoniobacterales bacterium]
MNRLGVDAYKRAFGHAISAKHWRALFDRTIERDNGAGEWERLDNYFEENPARASSRTAASSSLARERDLELIEDALHELAGVPNPSIDQLAYLWTKACDELSFQIARGAAPKRAKRSILNVLQRCGFVGRDLESIRRNFDRKFKRYIDEEGRLQDKRRVRYAEAAPIIKEHDRQTLVAAALNRGGRVSQAFRETLHSGALSPELTDRFIANPARKSYAPPSIRKAITAEVRRLMPIHHGPREHELRGAYANRDWSRMFAGDSYQADDCTCPVVYWEPDPSNRVGYRLIRGQLLLMIDERSLLALGFALHSENNYNARIIRALITRVHDSFGLPRKRFYFERGIWRSAKILTGGNHLPGALSFAETEMGLREFGVQFCHAKLPRGKVIERVLGLAQNQMERLPGYVGRDEINERFERVQKQINEARSGNRHPSEFLLSKEQWEETLVRLLSNYNAERQEGRILKGFSPLEAWNSLQSPEAQVHLGDQARYLLAHHKIKMRVGRNGITLRPSLGGGTYYGAATGELRGEEVLVWFNPEEPEYIALTSLDRKRLFVVPRADPLPAIGASKEEMARSKAQINAHNDYVKTAYRMIAPELAVHSFRRIAGVDARTVELGEELQTQVAEVKKQQTNTRANVRKVHDLSRKWNLQTPPELMPESAARVASGFARMEESRKQRAQQLGKET